MKATNIGANHGKCWAVAQRGCPCRGKRGLKHLWLRLSADLPAVGARWMGALESPPATKRGTRGFTILRETLPGPGAKVSSSISFNSPQYKMHHEQRGASFSVPTALSRLHLPSGGLLVAWAETTPRQNSCCPGPNQTCRQTSPPQRMAVRYSVHLGTGRRSRLAGQSEGRAGDTLGRSESAKKDNRATPSPSGFKMTPEVHTHAFLTQTDAFIQDEYVVSFASWLHSKHAKSCVNPGHIGRHCFRRSLNKNRRQGCKTTKTSHGRMPKPRAHVVSF